MKTLYLTRHQQIEIKDIVYLKSDSNYTVIHRTNQHRTIATQTLCLIHSSIEYTKFLRVNRSAILNVDHIASYSFENNKLTLSLSSGETFVASRRRVKDCIDKIEILQNHTDVPSI